MRDRQLHGSWEPAPSAEPEPVSAGAGIANPECIPAVNKTFCLYDMTVKLVVFLLLGHKTAWEILCREGSKGRVTP